MKWKGLAIHCAYCHGLLTEKGWLEHLNCMDNHRSQMIRIREALRVSCAMSEETGEVVEENTYDGEGVIVQPDPIVEKKDKSTETYYEWKEAEAKRKGNKL